MGSKNDKLGEDEYGCSSSGHDDYDLKYSHQEDQQIVENMKSTLTLDDLRVIREVKNFAKFKSHPNVVRYYASWVEPVLLNDELQEFSDSKVNSVQGSQNNLDSHLNHSQPNTSIETRNDQDIINEHCSIYDTINISPMDSTSDSKSVVDSPSNNNNYRNYNPKQNQNQSLKNNYTNSNSKSKVKTHFEKEDEDFDIFGCGPSDLRMMTSVPKNFIEDSNNYPVNSPSYQMPYNSYGYSVKEKGILDFMPSSFEAYSSFDPQRPVNSSPSLNTMDSNKNNNNLKQGHSLPLNSQDNLLITNSSEKFISSPTSNNIYSNINNNKSENNENLSQYNINVRNFYKNCDNQHSFLSSDTIENRNSYSTIHDSSFNTISETTTRNEQSNSFYTNGSIYDNHHSDSTSTISDDDESSLTLLELPLINSSNEELNILSSSQSNLNTTFTENELSTTENSIGIPNSDDIIFDDYGLENKEEIVTRFSENGDIFLTEQEEEGEGSNSENGEIPILPRDTLQSFEPKYNINSGGINIPNKGENRRHQSDNETCNSYNSTYSNNSIRTMHLDNQYNSDDSKDPLLKIQEDVNEEPYFNNQVHSNIVDGELYEENIDSNNPLAPFSNNNSNPNDYYDEEYSSGSSVSTIVDDCDLAKNTIYQIPASTMLYIQMEYSSSNNLRKWIRERNAKIWKHAPYLNNQEDSHVKHSKHWFLDYINRKKNLTILQQITMGLEHIHKSGFIHRDIKPANIFMSDNRLMIGDFGLAKKFIKDNEDYDINDLVITDEGDGQDHEQHLEMLMKEEILNDNKDNCSMKTMKCGGEHDLTLGVGTLLYASPEQLSRKPYSFATDIYSLSVIMLELFFPFCTSFDRMANLVNLRKGEIPDCLKKRWPEECALLLSMANVDPQERPTATEVLQTINRLLTHQPAKFSKIKNLYLPKHYDLLNPVFHAYPSTVKENEEYSTDTLLFSSDVEIEYPEDMEYAEEDEEEIRSEEDEVEKQKEKEENEQIDLLIDKLHQIQLSSEIKEESLNNLIKPVIDILSHKREKGQLRYHSCHADEIPLLNDKTVDQNFNDTPYPPPPPLQDLTSRYNPFVPDPVVDNSSNTVETTVDHDEELDEITPQPSKIHNSFNINTSSPLPPPFPTNSSNSSHSSNGSNGSNGSSGFNNSNDYLETKSNGMNESSSLPVICHNDIPMDRYPTSVKYNMFMNDRGIANNNPLQSYKGVGRRRNSYSPTHSNEYYLNKLKGIDHDSYYLTSPSTSQREGLLSPHESNTNIYNGFYPSGQKSMRKGNGRRSSLPNPNRLLAYNKTNSSSSTSRNNYKLSSTFRRSSSSSSNCRSFSQDFTTNTANTHHELCSEDGECQCEKCSENESLVLGLLAENATLAKRIKDLERRINSNSNSISPFGYHRTGKLK